MRRTTIGALVTLLLVGIVASSAFAFPGGRALRDNEAAQDAIEAGDYDAFVTAVSENGGERFAERLTEDRFAKIALRHQLREEIHNALDARDYDAWLEVVSDHPRAAQLTEKINEGNFDTLVELHEAKENGDRETARALAEELGIQKHPHRHGPRSPR